MAQTVNEVMTHDPQITSPGAPVTEAAQIMRNDDVGAVLIGDGDLQGIVTDRDITVRVVADGRDPDEVKVSEIATESPVTLTGDESVEDAAKLMREHDVRRLPVVQDGRPVGIVALGDLAVEGRGGDVLQDVSAAAPNN